jgi:hypothetical protein
MALKTTIRIISRPGFERTDAIIFTEPACQRCGTEVEEGLHPCPYSSDVGNDNSDCCNCCDNCTSDCADDI